MKIQTLFVETAWRLLLLLFLYTALDKILNFQSFVTKLAAQPMGLRFAPLLSYTLVAAELSIAGLLIVQRTRRIGVMGAVLLLGIFTVYVSLITFGAFARVPCSCAGVIESMGWSGHLVFNVCFLILSILTLRFYTGTTSPPPTVSRFGAR